jgi:hypothetical protein
MKNMRILSFLGVVLCAVPLLAQPPAPAAPDSNSASAANPRRVVAPCELTTATLSLSGEESPDQVSCWSLRTLCE